MPTLPQRGRISCTKCFHGFSSVIFDTTKRTQENWRITANPLAWGNVEPEIIVLGFSKGPTQAGALAGTPHDEIAYKGSRRNVGRILRHVGLLPEMSDDALGAAVDNLISDASGRFHFGSLIRCTVERFDEKKGGWSGSGGGMLDKFVATPFSKEVTRNCTTQFLQRLPKQTKLIVMFGMGSGLGYVQESYKLLSSTRGGDWRWINDVSYTDGDVTVVHVEHFASQGALIPEWLGERDSPRHRFAKMAKQGVCMAIGDRCPVNYAGQRTHATTHEAITPGPITKQAIQSRSPAHPKVDATDQVRIVITDGNLRHGHFYIDRATSPFPAAAWGGKNRLETGQKVTIEFEGTGDVVETDIDGSKRILRNARGQLRRFFDFHKLRAGDQIVISTLATDAYHVQPAS